MKINLKLILPIFLLMVIILTAFGYLLYYLNNQSKYLNAEAMKYERLNTLGQRLGKEQENTEYNILVYMFNQSPDALFAISQSEINKAKTIDEIYPYIDTEEGRKLVDNYISARKDISRTRSDLLNSIKSKNQKNIGQNYQKWIVQTQNIRDSINKLDDYNVTSFDLILNSFQNIGSRLIETILVLFAIVMFSVFLFYYYLRNTITLPIIKLSRYVNDISEARFSEIPKEDIGRNDEIGTLLESFTNMSKRLKLAYTSLEQNVIDRTLELTNRTKELENSQKATLNILEDLNNERKNLLQTKALDEAVLSSMGDCLVVMDINGNITYVNNEFEKVTGWKAEEVLQKKFVDVIPCQTEKGASVENAQRFLSKILTGQDPENDFITTMYYVRKNKTRFAVSSLVKRIMMEGKLIGAVKTFRDITTEKDIDKAKTEFVSLSAHQLRTPLSAVSWYTEMLLSGDAGELNDAQKKYLNQIYNGNQRMINMVKTFLDASRIELGEIKLKVESTNISKLLQSVIDEQRPQILTKGLDVLFSDGIEIPNACIDPKQIRMVLQNLLSNAIKYTPEKGKVTITISSDLENNSLLLKFSDTGYGIPLEDKSKIFTKLFRAKNVVEKNTEGTGLGLYIVKNIVENSGGKIWFDSEEGAGTNFYLTLPM